MLVPMTILATMLISQPDTLYRAEIEQWRRQREAALTSDEGWLTVVGLFWLKHGANTVGSDPASDIVLPKGSAPARVGAFDLRDGVVSFQSAANVTATVNGAAATSATLKPDSSGSPDVLRPNDLTLFVIERGGRYAIRLKDKNSEMRKAFAGIEYYPPKEEYRVKARFVPYNPPKMLTVPNILGQIERTPSPGYVVFKLHGREFRLDPVTEDNTLFFIFKDLTSGKETYPPGRFLNTEMPSNGEVILDFNKAYNPPCAFTPYATCPLPPEENKLPIAIEAGELRYGH
ncbi:MAG TPA: DUF1684 domain-containing protein [Terriglobia bacterium]|nr:DUF1684 domain-containing protein [Terriglobia bacterium]